jgi:DNA-binding NtrC family response regulator
LHYPFPKNRSYPLVEADCPSLLSVSKRYVELAHQLALCTPVREGPHAHVERVLKTNVQILLVDDDDEVRVVVGTILKSHGYDVAEAHNCDTALRLLGSSGFDVVLLDITLPDNSGFRVLEFIKENRLSSKVIMITGTIGLENAIKSATLGAKDYIAKPYNANYLLKSIEHVLSA